MLKAGLYDRQQSDCQVFWSSIFVWQNASRKGTTKAAAICCLGLAAVRALQYMHMLGNLEWLAQQRNACAASLHITASVLTDRQCCVERIASAGPASEFAAMPRNVKAVEYSRGNKL